MSETAITVSDVTMRFNLSKDKVGSLKEYMVKLIKRQLFYEEFTALKGVTFTVNKGEVFGVMGLNGAGKSTLLKIIAGVFKPTTGTVTINGELAPLLELGAGFDPEFSAKDNVFMNGSMFGHSTKYMAEKYNEIMDFAELWEFENVAVKNFSSGMTSRLGFAIATSIKPDILICDEILGVGDFRFRAKCQKLLESMIKSGVTVLLVSHDINTVKKMCSRAILLKKGEIVCMGNVNEVCDVYGEG